MLNLLLFILMSYGITNILLYGKIFDDYRNEWKKRLEGSKLIHLLQCNMCLSFHVGWVLYVVFLYSGIMLFPNIVFGMFLFGCLSSAANHFIFSIYDDNGIKIQKK